MKNLKNNFAIVPIVLSVLSVFIACKKDKVAPAPFDITKYVMVGKTVSNHLTTSDNYQYLLPFITTFETNNTSKTFMLGNDWNHTFTYKDAVLTLSNTRYIIDENNLTAYAENRPSEVFQLVIIPPNNLFNGNSYFGYRRVIPNGLVFYAATLKFSEYQFGEHLNDPFVNTHYTLIKNIAGVYKSQDEIQFWVHINDRLEVSKGSYTNGSVLTGTFNKTK